MKTTKLRTERLNRNWTLDYVAEKVGITNQAINLLERGQNRPSYKVLIKLLDLFGYKDPRQLFEVVYENTKQPDGS